MFRTKTFQAATFSVSDYQASDRCNNLNYCQLLTVSSEEFVQANPTDRFAEQLFEERKLEQ